MDVKPQYSVSGVWFLYFLASLGTLNLGADDTDTAVHTTDIPTNTSAANSPLFYFHSCTKILVTC